MTFDPRDVAFEWAWTKGWKVELAGTTVTVRDDEDYVMAEVDLSHVQPAMASTGRTRPRAAEERGSYGSTFLRLFGESGPLETETRP